MPDALIDVDAPGTIGQRLAEFVAGLVGSWWFIGAQSMALMGWVYFNAQGVIHFDPYPFILLNLVLSLQAAYTAPMILMAANRQNEKDRRVLYDDYRLERELKERIDSIESKVDLLLNSLPKDR